MFHDAISTYQLDSVREQKPHIHATQIANSHEGLGLLYFLRGEDNAAEREWEWVRQSFLRGDFRDAASVAPALKNLADLRLRRQDFVGARDLFAYALEVLLSDARYGEDHERCAFLRENIDAIDATLDG